MTHLASQVHVFVTVLVVTRTLVTPYQSNSESAKVEHCNELSSLCLDSLVAHTDNSTYFNLSALQMALQNLTLLAELPHSPLAELPDGRFIWQEKSLIHDAIFDLYMADDCLNKVATWVPECEDLPRVNWSEPVILAMRFLLEVGMPDKMMAASSSSCLADQDVMNEADEEFMQCARTFVQDVHGNSTSSALCASFSRLWQCLEDGGRRVCGADFAEIIQRLRRKAFGAVEPSFLAWLTSATGLEFSTCEDVSH